MLTCRKFLIIYLLAVLTFTLAGKASASEVSAAGGCKKPNSHPDAYGFYKKIKSYPKWKKNFYLKYKKCKEIHYKRAPGGQEHKWIDTSDIHYHVSHGSRTQDNVYGRPVIGVKFEDGKTLVPSEAAMAWGDQDLEWIGFRCCQLLSDLSWDLWAKTMMRLHLILGFKTNSCKHDKFGKIWAQEMRKRKKHSWWWPPCKKKTIKARTVTQAWFKATDKTQPKWVVARVIAEESDNFRDHLWCNGYVSSDPTVDDVKFLWEHKAGSPPYLDVNDICDMYIYWVVPRVPNESYIRNIGVAFGMMSPGEAIIDLEDDYIMTRLDDPNDPNSAHILEVFKASGMYYYHDVGRLWEPNLAVGSFPSEPCMVKSATDSLVAYNLYPSDVGANDVEYEYIYEKDVNDPDVNIPYPQHCCVIYARQLAGGPGKPVSVAGPGARLKVYLDENEDIIGAMGNWRDVQVPPGPNTVPVMSKGDAWGLYQTYGDKIAVAPIYADYDTVTTDLNTATLAYYEHSGLDIQRRLIPVWIFDANYVAAGNFVTRADVHIPVDYSFCPPITSITSPSDPCEVDVGQTIEFRCSVADPNFARDCTYEWESDVDGDLSDANSFDTNSLSVSCVDYSCHCEVVPHIITLTVTDANGLEYVDTVTVTVNGDCRECRDCADLNRDGTVNFEDFGSFADSWLAESYKEEP